MVSTASAVVRPATSVSQTKDSIPIALRIAIASRRMPSGSRRRRAAALLTNPTDFFVGR